MSKLKNKILNGFKNPTALPNSEAETQEWQKANYSWWEDHPMRYDWKEKVPAQEFSKDFYEEIDRRSFSNSKEYLPWTQTPFDQLIDFENLKNKDVLEIGVGNGSHAGLLAKAAKSFIGIDITDYAVKSVSERLKIFGLKGEIKKMEGEKLGFSNDSFDFVWSWGVIHHSSSTPMILDEIYRVLRPNGTAVLMVYHRGWWNYYIIGAIQWFLSRDFLRGRSLHESVQMHTDGAIARYYSASDFKKLTAKFITQKINILGPKSDLIILPAGEIKGFITKIFPSTLSRFLTNKLKMGSFFVIKIKKSD